MMVQQSSILEILLAVGILAYTNVSCNAFTLSPNKSLDAKSGLHAVTKVTSLDSTFVPPDTIAAGITEQACAAAASKMQRVNVPVSTSISDTGSVGISFIHWKPKVPKKGTLPLLLVHGFDSSCLEYRRLGPILADEMGIDTYAVDLLGWGYTQLNNVNSFSAKAKVEALAGFWEVVGQGKDVCVGGASLGGAAAIEFAAQNPAVKGCVLIDAQGFVDGVGPMAQLPKVLAQAGVKVLKSVPLRNSANVMSYYDTDTFATKDALKTGRLHVLRDGWEDALVSFMLDGGFYPSEKVAQIKAPTLILWGRQDGILEIKFAEKFLDIIPDAQLEWIEECGHVPHLEQPQKTSEQIVKFLTSEKFEGQDSNGNTASDPLIVGSVAAAAALVGTALVGSM